MSDAPGASEFQSLYAQLQAMRAHVPNVVEEPFVTEYNRILEDLQKQPECYSRNLSAYRIADSELRRVSGLSYGDDCDTETRPPVYGSIRCDQDLFLRRIDGLLLYLERQARPGKRKVGFA